MWPLKKPPWWEPRTQDSASKSLLSSDSLSELQGLTMPILCNGCDKPWPGTNHQSTFFGDEGVGVDFPKTASGKHQKHILRDIAVALIQPAIRSRL
jgi:hypothetical protein